MIQKMIRTNGMSEIGRIFIEHHRKHLNDRDFHGSVFKERDSLSPQRQKQISDNLKKSIRKESERIRIKQIGQVRRKKIKSLKDKINKVYRKEEIKTKIENNKLLVFIKNIWNYYFNKTDNGEISI